MGDDVGHGVEILPGLVLDGLDDFRLGIADVQDADAADPVEEIVAVYIFKHGAFAALDDRWIDSADGIRDSLGGGRARDGRRLSGRERSG